MDTTPITLTGRAIRLEPLSPAHAEDLYPLFDDLVATYLLHWEKQPTVEAFRDHVADLARRSGYLTFAVIQQESGRAIGSSSFFDISPKNRSLEIGATWIGSAFHQAGVNPEMKYLMLQQAFEVWECCRVQLKTDARNAQSRAAMLKLGCQFEGVLRKHMMRPDGFIRDTAFFSILDSEWPEVKAKLIQRLGYSL